MGFVHKKFDKAPEDIVKMSPKQAANFLMDLIGALEKEGRAGSYISGVVKPLKNWLDFNSIHISQRIKIRGRDELVRFADERPPTPEELHKIMAVADVRAKSALAIVAFSGTRLEVIGNYLGNDGLRLSDLPEMKLKGKEVEFQETPAILVVRKPLSKTGNQYFTFLADEGCEYVKHYLEWRLLKGEKLTAKSPLITPNHPLHIGEFIRTTNVGDLIRRPIRMAGFDWRPYVLRRYFDTRLMMAESDGLIIRDYRTYWMGRKGDIEFVYTVGKAVSTDVLEKMRDSYAKASAKYLETAGRKEGVTKADMVSEFNKQFLRLSGYREEEISKLGDLSQMSTEHLQEMIRRKSMEALGLNGNHQKIVPLLELRNYIMQGWEYVSQLPNNEAIIRLPTN